ncbi:hypothetical protein PT974_01663 [Cladobotryum mycophilum]|uniref:Uncharacterized protein n=1 Tax=Cladobotryum mycophilum TaxID=491253 RepID=A0ABR0T5F5_9HYPO
MVPDCKRPTFIPIPHCYFGKVGQEEVHVAAFMLVHILHLLLFAPTN